MKLAQGRTLEGVLFSTEGVFFLIMGVKILANKNVFLSLFKPADGEYCLIAGLKFRFQDLLNY